MNVIRLAIALTVLGAFFMVPLNPAFAQSDRAYIKYRQDLMKSQGGNMAAIVTILKEKLPLQQNIKDHAASLHATALLIASAFKHKVVQGKTDAKAKIWEDYSSFEKHAKKLENASAKLEQVAAGSDMKATFAAVKGVGKACGGCHKEFRKDKEHSYKRRM